MMSGRFSLKQLLLLVAAVAIAAWLYGSFYPLGPLFALVFGLACLAMVAVCYRKLLPAALCILAILAVGVFGYPIVVMSAHPVPLYRLNQVQPGMTESEVESLLGPPTRTRDGDWEYSGVTFCHVTVRFSTDRKVEYVVHDH